MNPKTPTPEAILREQCRRSFPTFAAHCSILSETAGPAADWIPFALWPAQENVARQFQDNRLCVVLKARQLGLTWLALAFALWHVHLHPVATVLLFSRRDDEATDLLQRLKWMRDRLPPWLKTAETVVDNDHELQLSNGSRVMAFPTTAGDSYTATLAIVDEADLVPDLDRLLRQVKPTTDAAGRLLLISRSDKTTPESAFKRVYKAARAGASDWRAVFLPWDARPDRDAAWYERQKRDILARTGADDDLREQYPATDAEALAPRTLDKRLPPAWLVKCFKERTPITDFPTNRRPPAIPGLEIYVLPVPGRRYAIGADPAEGNVNSDPSALDVIDVESGEEVAALNGRFEPSTFANYIALLSNFYHRAPAMVERNNHGHAVLLWLRDNSTVTRLCGADLLPGWATTSKSKSLLYDAAAEALRDADAILNAERTFFELASVEGSSLLAPQGQHDDQAVAFVLALAARAQLRGRSAACGDPCVLIPAPGMTPPRDYYDNLPFDEPPRGSGFRPLGGFDPRPTNEPFIDPKRW